jgi:hypothetical protein
MCRNRGEGRFVLIKTCERSVEALHAQTSKDIKLATNHTSAHFALKNAIPILIKQLSTHPKELARLAA